MDPDCIFCKIAAGEIPCHKLYEDDRVLAFLDLGPLATGHALLIPKAHARTVADMTDEDAAAVGRALPRLCRAVMKATGCNDYNVLVNIGENAGQVVMHTHFHIIPKPPIAPRRNGPPGSGLGLYWPAQELDHEQAKLLAKQIADAI